MSESIDDAYQCKVCYQFISPQKCFDLIKRCQAKYKNNMSGQNRRGQGQRGQNIEILQTMKKPSRNQVGYQGQGE